MSRDFFFGVLVGAAAMGVALHFWLIRPMARMLWGDNQAEGER